MTTLDQLITEFDKALRTVFAPASAVRSMPGADLPEAVMDESVRRHTAALMRVNHCGEICAQALYQGQALTSHDPSIKQALEQAAQEETEHLAWTERRITELGGRKSLLNPLWYGGALAIGVLAGKFGDAWNLGFLAETERQVETHLESHKARLAEEDMRSRKVLEQMRLDEIGHADTAMRLGARELPVPVKRLMLLASTAMTKTAYYI
ncbi:MAG: 2-polyprenyl-3-methyl-6-methoxy-1,4-benzoquinone monooxygenase [Betaproteobacteria bacterium]|nr:2-polyprenyl-3-methyl-6-methoxy-1,4-benzoquinone monooxygenase [Betaproteobacteria bacterium]